MPMIDLNLLKVSLTKHGAHKLALLLRKYEASVLLKHLWGSIEDVKIEVVQAKKNLSVRGDVVPPVWDKARALGDSAIDALVLIAIIFSHHNLISVMIASSDENVPFAGTIIRGRHLDGKAFTNFAHTLDELGYATEHSKNHLRYELSSLFKIVGLNNIAMELLKLKLTTAGWDGKENAIDVAVSLDFHGVFSTTAEEFKEWLINGSLISADGGDQTVDIAFFENASDVVDVNKFVFKSGHNVRKTGVVGVKRPVGEVKAELIHNAMQNKLYAILVEKYGVESVGTEVPSGADTSIDIVVKTQKKCVFYEIKTANSVKACIRQAIPQLLEYAYWHGAADRVDELVIVGPIPETIHARRYLALLQDKFGIPISYKHLTMP